jgi:hypothetical protein
LSLNQQVHDRLGRAFQRWEDMRQTGVSKHDLKMRGIRESGDPNQRSAHLGFTTPSGASIQALHADRRKGIPNTEGPTTSLPVTVTIPP